jgi:hypothetical protein
VPAQAVDCAAGEERSGRAAAARGRLVARGTRDNATGRRRRRQPGVRMNRAHVNRVVPRVIQPWPVFARAHPRLRPLAPCAVARRSAPASALRHLSSPLSLAPLSAHDAHAHARAGGAAFAHACARARLADVRAGGAHRTHAHALQPGSSAQQAKAQSPHAAACPAKPAALPRAPWKGPF